MTGAAEWQGVVGNAWSDEWRRTDRSFAGLDPPLDAAIGSLAPERGVALDIGCGAGRTSLTLAAARPGLTITGIDLSPALIETARERAGGDRQLDFTIGNASRPPVGPPFDLLFSRHGVMFFDDPQAAFARLHAAAARDAALVFSCFRSPRENTWASALTTAIGVAPPPALAGYAPGPFAFADQEFVARLLADAGWRDTTATPADYTYIAGQGTNPIADAVSFFQRIGPSAAAFAAWPAPTATRSPPDWRPRSNRTARMMSSPYPPRPGSGPLVPEEKP